MRAGMGREQTVFVLSEKNKSVASLVYICYERLKSEIACAVLFQTPSSSPSPPRRRNRLSLAGRSQVRVDQVMKLPVR